jgi:type I restriction-modification system DNA methylase subunit
MSSTKRSKSRDSHVADYYVTPIQSVVKFLNDIQTYEPNIFKGKILDPCAGGDINHSMSYPEAFKQIEIHNIDTIDIRNDSLAEIKTDYLTYDYKNKYDVIITNPPFAIAKDIITR